MRLQMPPIVCQHDVTNNILTYVTSIVAINSDDKTARYIMDCYIHTISLVIVSLLLILVVNSIGCYFYSIGQKQRYYNTVLR